MFNVPNFLIVVPDYRTRCRYAVPARPRLRHDQVRAGGGENRLREDSGLRIPR